MNYNLHDLIYNYSKIHEDLLNAGLDFLGTAMHHKLHSAETVESEHDRSNFEERSTKLGPGG